MPVDTRKEAGLILYRRDLAYPGYTLYTPLIGNGEVYLIDMLGNVVHRWMCPGPPGNYGSLLNDGNLLYSQRTAGGPPLSGKGGRIYEVTWDGEIVWEYHNDAMHHDYDRLPNGNTLVLIWEPVPAELHAGIKGGLPGTEDNGTIWGDAILEVTPAGEVVWEWHAHEHLDGEADSLCPICPRYEWAHANAIDAVTLQDGRQAILISFRWSNMIALIDRSTGDWIWKWGRDDLGHQHDPTYLDNGNVLVFDNGLHYLVNKKHAAQQLVARGTTRSRLLEINPATGEICWQYMGRPRYAFFSPFLSGAQRLPNGNTLACEGISGHFLELTKEGELAWEYVVPFFGAFRDYGNVNMCFRCYRYGPDFPGFAGKDLDPARYQWLNHLLNGAGRS